jgi:hypothetical protein
MAERIYQTNIFRPNLTEEFKYIAFVLKEKFSERWQTPTQKLCRDQFCVTTTGSFGPNVPTFGCPGGMSPICWQPCQRSAAPHFVESAKNLGSVCLQMMPHF